jgi:surface antigen
MDDRDRGCFGQALELGTGGRRINWVNPGSGVRYALVPLDGPRAGGAVCRNFELTTTRGRDVDVRRGRACQARPGVWELAR